MTAVNSITPNGIPFQELEGSPTLRINTEGISGERKFWVPDTNNLAPFVQEVMGVWVIVGQQNGQGGQCQFQPPMPFPGYINVVPDDIQVAPRMPSSPMGNFPVTLDGVTNDYKGGWEVTVHYKTIYNLQQQINGMPGVPTGTYLSYEADLSAEYLTIPGRTWVWMVAPGNPSNQTPLDEDTNPGILMPTGSYTLTWERVLAPPWSTIRAARGKVNSGTFLNAPAGTVLFLGAQVKRQYQFTSDGGFWQVQYKFSENVKTQNSGTQVGWNYFFRPAALNGENWVLVGTKDGAHDPPYQSYDFDGLFEFDQGLQCS